VWSQLVFTCVQALAGGDPKAFQMVENTLAGAVNKNCTPT
jgi:hypothetical protein